MGWRAQIKVLNAALRVLSVDMPPTLRGVAKRLSDRLVVGLRRFGSL